MVDSGTRWHPAVLYQTTGQGTATTLRCDLCPFRCVLREGQTGVCGVRRRVGNRLETATFGTSVRHWTAVERKPFYHYRPGLKVLTLAAPGCTFRCDYCVNFRVSQVASGDAALGELDPATPQELVAQAADAGAAIGLSYTEPGLAPEFTLALAEAAGRAGIELLWKSNGFLTPAALDLMAPVLAAVNVDVKAADEEAHRRLTGASLAPVLDAVEALRARGVWVEVTTPLIPGVSDQTSQYTEIARSIARIDPAIPWHLMRFTPSFRMQNEDPGAPTELAAAREAGHAAGLRYVYVERALGPEGRDTGCPGCGTTVVRRGIWALESLELVDGRCAACGTHLEGRW